jgi:hypothetical protein
MSLQSDLVTALAGVAGGQVYPDAVPADIDKPYVVYRVKNESPLSRLNGTVDLIKFSVDFLCFENTYNESLTLAGAVRAAINAITPTATFMFFPTTSSGEDYVVPVDDYMVPVSFGFWHT